MTKQRKRPSRKMSKLQLGLPRLKRAKAKIKGKTLKSEPHSLRRTKRRRTRRAALEIAKMTMRPRPKTTRRRKMSLLRILMPHMK